MDPPATPRQEGPSTPTRLSIASVHNTPDQALMAPLEPVSSERINKQMGAPTTPSAGGRTSNVSNHSLMSPIRHGHSRDSSVSDKVNVFNNLAAQGKQLERKSQDAALKRAVLGREEAEAEARRFKDEMRALRKQLEEGRDRERRVGERLETVMVCLSRKP